MLETQIINNEIWEEINVLDSAFIAYIDSKDLERTK